MVEEVSLVGGDYTQLFSKTQTAWLWLARVCRGSSSRPFRLLLNLKNLNFPDNVNSMNSLEINKWHIAGKCIHGEKKWRSPTFAQSASGERRGRRCVLACHVKRSRQALTCMMEVSPELFFPVHELFDTALDDILPFAFQISFFRQKRNPRILNYVDLVDHLYNPEDFRVHFHMTRLVDLRPAGAVHRQYSRTTSWSTVFRPTAYSAQETTVTLLVVSWNQRNVCQRRRSVWRRSLHRVCYPWEDDRRILFSSREHHFVAALSWWNFQSLSRLSRSVQCRWNHWSYRWISRSDSPSGWWWAVLL